MGHLALEPADRFGDALRVERIASFLPDQGQQACQVGIIVKHLLEMRREPARIGRIARKAAAEMVVDAALRDRCQRADDGLTIGLAAGALPGAPQQFEDAALREFRRVADAAVQRVDLAQQALGDLVEEFRRDALAGLRLLEALQRLAQGDDVLHDVVAVLLVGRADRVQDLRKARAAPARLGRVIGAAPEGLALGGEEHRQRPAALLAHQRQRVLIDRVEVGALLAIDLDVDEPLVHLRRDRRFLEAFMRHDMAPVAGGIADRQQNGLVFGLGGGERVGSPCLPLHRIILVLQQVRAGLVAEAVAVHVQAPDGCFAPRLLARRGSTR